MPSETPSSRRPVRSAPRRDPIGAPDAPAAETVVGLQLDHIEQQLHDLQKQITQLQRMASLGTMSAVLAHEFNNLLTPIITYSQYALGRDDPALWRTAVERANKNALQLAAICERILGYAANRDQQTAALNARTLLTESVENLGRDLSKDGIEVRIDAPAELTLTACPAGIQQVLFNLVMNAWHAMLDRPGRLSLAARADETGGVILTVADTGCGISPENLPRIFEPFFTTKADESKSYRRGAGLGLHVCRQIVEEHHGALNVQSRPGQGTTFTISLPRRVAS